MTNVRDETERAEVGNANVRNGSGTDIQPEPDQTFVARDGCTPAFSARWEGIRQTIVQRPGCVRPTGQVVRSCVGVASVSHDQHMKTAIADDDVFRTRAPLRTPAQALPCGVSKGQAKRAKA